jgi:hypothetical protein
MSKTWHRKRDKWDDYDPYEQANKRRSQSQKNWQRRNKKYDWFDTTADEDVEYK